MQIREPEVNVSLKVRPLRSNWRAVKRIELSGSDQSDPIGSPAKEMLFADVWKTKVVKTEFVREGSQGTTVCESESEDGESLKESGLVEKCTCKKCYLADTVSTSNECSIIQNQPVHPNRSDTGLASQKKSKTKKPKDNKSTEPKKAEVFGWSKLYGDRSEKSPLIPQPPPPTPADSNPQMPLIRHPIISPSSSISISYPLDDESNPPLLPIPKSKVEPPNVQPAPVNDKSGETGKSIMTSMIETVADKMTMSSKSPSKGSSIKKNESLTERIPTPPLMPSPPPTKYSNRKGVEKKPKNQKTLQNTISHTSISSQTSLSQNTTMIRRIEKMFYASESNMWMCVAIIILIILTYRSSVDTHTCYYDD